jgi:hypothetical protein
MRLKRPLVIAASALAAASFTLGLAGGSAAQSEGTIPAGFDLFETDAEQTVFKFEGGTAIPAGFFTTKSQAFEGDVAFGGVPIGQFRGKDAGSADTVVRRSAAGIFPQSGGNPTVPIKLVRLSLVGVAPIDVRVGGATQAWDVRAEVSPSRPSTGTLEIRRESDGGGIFYSELHVYPKFTFTRLSDGKTRQFDVGALPDGTRPDDPVQVNDTYWRSGCIAPALDTGLSPNFCPGQDYHDGQVTGLREDSPQAHLFVRPAQPRLEHFACYNAGKAGEESLGVSLLDQFGETPSGNPVVKIFRDSGGELCNPARKNKEPRVGNKHDHLRCYLIDGRGSIDRDVRLRNQFGPFSARVLTPRQLCVPSTKQVIPSSGKLPQAPEQTFLTDHFLCYDIKPAGKFKSRSVVLSDQFGKHKVSVRRPSKLCVPVDKNDEGIKHPAQHFVCYPAEGRSPKKRVRVENQFGVERFRVLKLAELCVPSIKVRVPATDQVPGGKTSRSVLG